MDTASPVTPPPPPSSTPVVTSSPGIFGTRMPASIAFGIAVLLFFLPFADLRCNGMSLKKISGVELATGFHIKNSGSTGLFDELPTDNKTDKETKKDPYLPAMIALVLGVVGLVFSFVKGRSAAIAGMVSGVLAAVSMIIMIFDVKSDLKKEISTGQGNDVKLSLDFTEAFYISLLLLLAAAYFSYRRSKPPVSNTVYTQV